jgi:hypothetical protein
MLVYKKMTLCDATELMDYCENVGIRYHICLTPKQVSESHPMEIGLSETDWKLFPDLVSVYFY